MALNYTSDDFQKQLNASGLAGQFSQYDLDLAAKNPDFGISMIGLKQDYAAAKTDEERLLINEMANQLRTSNGGYSGGADGSKYILTSELPSQIKGVTNQINDYGSFSYDQTAPTYENQYGQYQQQLLDSLLGQGSFSYDTPAPTYENQYSQYQQQLLDSILNREDFSWSKESDPQWSSYKKEYLREGERASANALAQASAASGGRASSYAATAASQAGDYYATKLSDAIPTLYQQAYDRYLQEYNMKLSDLGAVNSQEQLDYAKYLDQLGQYNADRSFALDSWQSQQNQLLNQLGAVNQLDQMDWSKYLDQLGQYNTDRNFAYNQYLGDFDILQGKLSSLSGQNTADQNWYLSLLDRQAQQAQTQYEQGLQGASVLASAGDYSGYAELWGFTPEQTQALVAQYAKEQKLSDQQAAMELAGFFAQYGDTAQLAGMGVDTSYQDAVNAANLKILQGQAGAYSQSGGGSSYQSTPTNPTNPTNPMTLTDAEKMAKAGIFTPEVVNAFLAKGFNEDYLRTTYGYSGSGGNTSGGSGGGQDSYADATVDINSVLALGYGPISEDRLAELEAAGMIASYVSGGKIYFENVQNAAASRSAPRAGVGITMPVRP